MAEEIQNNFSPKKSLRPYIVGFITFLIVSSGIALATSPKTFVKGTSDQVSPTPIVTVSPTATNTPTPTVTPSPAPTSKPIFTPKPTVFIPTSAPVSNTGSEDKYYINVDGNKVKSPSYSDSVPSDATAQCRDGSYSYSQHRQGTCSGHGGVAQWL